MRSVTNTSNGYDFSQSHVDPSKWHNPMGVEFVFHFPGQWTPWIEPRCLVGNVSGSLVSVVEPCYTMNMLPTWQHVHSVKVGCHKALSGTVQSVCGVTARPCTDLLGDMLVRTSGLGVRQLVASHGSLRRYSSTTMASFFIRPKWCRWTPSRPPMALHPGIAPRV
eukprot:COSAG02_NODE_2201_length_9535_cov_20.999364_6_plen_165_part_00